MQPAPSDPAEPPGFRRLRLMVTALTATLMIGIIVIATTLVIRIVTEQGPAPLSAPLAPTVALPEGEAVIAVGAGPGALTLLTRDDAGAERLRVFHPRTGEPVGETRIVRKAAE